VSPKPSRKEIAKLGRRGRWVRVVEGVHRGAKVYWVEHKVLPDLRRTAVPFPRTRAGKVEATNYATGIALEQEQAAKPAEPLRLTVDQLWVRYVEAEFPAFRPNTKRIYRDGWKPWALFVGPATIAEDLGRDSMAQLRAELDRRGWAVNTIRKTFGVVRAVYKWALEGELIQRNRVGTYVYKVPKEQRPKSPAEFRQEDLDGMLAALPLDSTRHWRAHAVLAVCGNQGARQWSVLHLTWPDVHFDAGEIIWQGAWNKTGETWDQPMREATRAVLEVALLRRSEAGYEGPYVFFPARLGNKQGFYTEQSLWYALKAAEIDAKIPHLPGRGAHGLRRLLAGEVNELTGSMKTAMDAIGDRTIRMAERYLKVRNDRLVAAFKALDARRKVVIPTEVTSNLQAEGGSDA
jgi:integrase